MTHQHKHQTTHHQLKLLPIRPNLIHLVRLVRKPISLLKDLINLVTRHSLHLVKLYLLLNLVIRVPLLNQLPVTPLLLLRITVAHHQLMYQLNPQSLHNNFQTRTQTLLMINLITVLRTDRILLETTTSDGMMVTTRHGLMLSTKEQQPLLLDRRTPKTGQTHFKKLCMTFMKYKETII